MCFKHGKTIFPQHLEILEGSAAKVFCVSAPADEVWEGDKGMPV